MKRKTGKMGNRRLFGDKSGEPASCTCDKCSRKLLIRKTLI